MSFASSILYILSILLSCQKIDSAHDSRAAFAVEGVGEVVDVGDDGGGVGVG